MGKRVEFLDIAKGFAILGVVFSHTLHFESEYFLNFKFFVGTYMVMLFYISAGYIYSMKQHKQIFLCVYIKKLSKSLIIPYLYFSVFQIILDTVLIVSSNEQFLIATNLSGFKVIVGDVYKTLCFKGIGTLWFISSLFICSIIYHFQCKRIKTFTGQNTVIILEALTSYVIYLIVGHINSGAIVDEVLSAPFLVVGRALFAIPLMHLGCVLHDKFEGFFFKEVKKASIISGVLGVVLFFLISMLRENSSYDLNHLYIPKPYLTYLFGVLGSLFILTLSFAISGICSFKFLQMCSKYSMVIMCVHYPLRPFIDSFVCWSLKSIRAEVLISYYEIGTLILLILISYYMAKIISNKFSFILGK